MRRFALPAGLADVAIARARPPPTIAGVIALAHGARLARSRSARTAVAAGQLAVLGPGDLLALRSAAGGRALCLAGRPIGEPVARYGPFVMNTEDQIRQAVDDYRAGRSVGG